MNSKLLKPLLLAALAALPLLSPNHSARAQSSGATQTPVQPSAQPTEEKWERYTYAGEEFSAETPSMPFVFETSRRISMTETEKLRTFGLYSEGVIFIIESFDKPRAPETLDYFASFHWSTQSLNYVRDVKLGGFDGREYVTTDALRSRVLVFRAKKHAYVLRAITRGADDLRVARFINSFTLGGKPSGTQIYEPPPPAVLIPTGPPIPTAPERGVGTGTGGEGNLKLEQREGAPTAHVPGEPYKSRELTRKAIIVFKPEPGFTETARRKAITGVVRLRVVLASDGKVKQISVIKGLPEGLTEKAVNAARHILFFPAELDGNVVSQYVILEYNFNIY